MRVNEDYLNTFFNDKSVMVLGSAPNVVNTKSSFMDEFDCIVRVNNYSFFNDCRRVDVFYSFLGKTIRKQAINLNEDGCKLVMCKCPNDEIIVKDSDNKINEKLTGDYKWIYEFRNKFFNDLDADYYIQNEQNFNENNLKVGQIITTGVAAILDVIRYRPKLLYFAGFDFGMSKMHNITEEMIIKEGNNRHHFKEEFELMRDIFNYDDHIDCSNDIKELFKNSFSFFAD